jgi:hypothetical protein
MDIVQQAKDAATEAIEADFQRVFAAWQKMAPWQHSEKGGAGSGNFGHSGRPGQRGGSDDSGGGTSPSAGGNSGDTPKPTGKPTGVSSRPVSRTQAMQIAKQRLGAGEPGNFLANNDVPPDMNLDLGKAFMLDVERGHDSWDAVIDLTTWKER